MVSDGLNYAAGSLTVLIFTVWLLAQSLVYSSRLIQRYLKRKRFISKMLGTPPTLISPAENPTDDQIHLFREEEGPHFILSVLWYKFNYYQTRSIKFITNNLGVKEFLLLFSYLLINISVVVVNPHWYESDRPVSPLTTEELANRFGYMALSNMFFICITATRNSILTSMTSYAFEHYIMFHRWMGRVIFAFVIMHMITHLSAVESISNLFKKSSNLSGLLGFVALCLVMITSYSYFRRNWFRTFYYTHFLFIGFFVGTVLHTKDALLFVAPGFALYAFDRFVRLYRSNFTESRIVKVSLLPENVLKLTLSNEHVGRRYQAGHYIFLNFPDLHPLDWHPFTISSWPEFETVKDKPLETADMELKRLDRFTVHIKGLGDMTRRLRSFADEKAQQKEVKETIRIRVDGPYGLSCSTNVHTSFLDHPVAVLLCGGIGITPMISILGDLINRVEFGHSYYCDTIYFVWAIQNRSQYDWFRRELLYLVKRVEGLNARRQELVKRGPAVDPYLVMGNYRPCRLKMQVYITQEDVTELQTEETPSMRFFRGRPDVETIMTSVKLDLRGYYDVGVGVCGPKTLVRATRQAAFKLSNTESIFHLHWDQFSL